MSYKLEVEVNGKTETYTNHTDNSIFLYRTTADQLTIKIWAVNEIGESENYTEVLIPSEWGNEQLSVS